MVCAIRMDMSLELRNQNLTLVASGMKRGNISLWRSGKFATAR